MMLAVNKKFDKIVKVFTKMAAELDGLIDDLAIRIAVNNERIDELNDQNSEYSELAYKLAVVRDKIAGIAS